MHLKTLVEVEEAFRGKELELVAQPEIEKTQIRIGKILENKYQLTEEMRHLDRDLEDGIINEKEYYDLRVDYINRIE